jgi:hypothetical protein
MDNFLENPIRPFLGFIGLGISRGFEKTLVLRRIVGLWLWFLLHSPTIS